ncbi:MAG TPA: hypothetical protein PKZ42_05570 [Syntrophales bacterium]|nr:hypothetical protein [Syntrophales bacterium]
MNLFNNIKKIIQTHLFNNVDDSFELSLKKGLYKRQFVLGPYWIKKFERWNNVKICDDLYLSSHPELEVTKVCSGDMTFVLIGYILDPYHVEATNQQILNTIADQNRKNLSELFNNLVQYGGRWILIVISKKQKMMFSDAAGLRQVFYFQDTNQFTWCASQPGLLAEELKIKPDPEAVDFMDWVNHQRVEEYWWPDDRSLYRAIRHLLPNHYLDLTNCKVCRFWPSKKIEKVSLNDGVEKGAEILTGLLKSAHLRFPLALAVTAGWDSRLLLAASRDISQKVFYYTLLYHKVTREHMDVDIPGRILARLNLDHHIIDCSDSMDNEFAEIYLHNVSCAHEYWGGIAQGIIKNFPDNHVHIKGNISEIARIGNRYKMDLSTASGESIARIFQLDKVYFAQKYIKKWVDRSIDCCSKNNINIMELFRWENISGNWLAMAQQEQDIAYEVFIPFNCRLLLEIFLGVDENLRGHQECVLYRNIISELWPEVLCEEINPKD